MLLHYAFPNPTRNSIKRRNPNWLGVVPSNSVWRINKQQIKTKLCEQRKEVKAVMFVNIIDLHPGFEIGNKKVDHSLYITEKCM